MNGAQQIVGGLLAYCFSLIKPGGALKSWQAIFLTYGSFSLLWGIFVLWWLPGKRIPSLLMLGPC
jgi:hypothetical protein